jgi:hypothetical protein
MWGPKMPAQHYTPNQCPSLPIQGPKSECWVESRCQGEESMLWWLQKLFHIIDICKVALTEPR